MGKLEVICGPMFSGKSEELLRRLKRAQIAKQSFKLYKPAIDNRYSDNCVVTHSGIECACTQISNAEALLTTESYVDIIAIDEVQFLGENTPNIIEKLVNNGKRVIVAGLDMDSYGYPFGPMPQLLAKAESVLKVVAVCEKCTADATHTYRHNQSISNHATFDTILIGASDHYEARCRSCWLVRYDVDMPSVALSAQNHKK